MCPSRPHIKHVIMAYGVDTNTEVSYEYKKLYTEVENPKEFDSVPRLARVIWECAGGELFEQVIDSVRGNIADSLVKKKPKMNSIKDGVLMHSGDGTIPYLSLSWAHTWLLHAIRAKRFMGKTPAGAHVLEDVDVSHRPAGAMEWKEGPPARYANATRVHVQDTRKKKEDADTGTYHPHGTKYKPEMVRYHNVGQSRRTKNEYSTTVIEAIGVEHKETTRYV